MVQHYQLKKNNEILAEVIELEENGMTIAYYSASKILMTYRSIEHLKTTNEESELIFSWKWNEPY